MSSEELGEFRHLTGSHPDFQVLTATNPAVQAVHRHMRVGIGEVEHG